MKVARITNDKKLLIADEIVEGEDVRFTSDGTLYLNEFIEGDTFSVSEDEFVAVELEENSDIPDYVLATDEDFSGNSDGQFRYIGTDEYVIVPHEIKGVPVTRYRYMFRSSNVKGVISDNSNVTDATHMFSDSQSADLDVSNIDTSSFEDVTSMFSSSQATELNLSNFDTSNVTVMNDMFSGSQATGLDLSSFDTSNVTSMIRMFYGSQATELDLSSFDTSNVTNANNMFQNAQATIGYARTQADADFFNNTSNKPSHLNFVVKE